MNPNNFRVLGRLYFGNSLEILKYKPDFYTETFDKFINNIFNSIPSYKPLIQENIPNVHDDENIKLENEYLQLYPNSFLPSTTTWLKHCALEKYPIREKAALFWHNHFPTIGDNNTRVIELIEIFRKYSLGSLKELLQALFLNPNFANFLTNIDSSKVSPNQNLAREFLELFTLGIGNYSEVDVRELSRAFTGFSLDTASDTLYYNNNIADTGVKNILGNNNIYNYQEAIDQILSLDQCAYFIAQKIIKFYVGDSSDKLLVKNLAKHYKENNYNFLSALEFLFAQPNIIKNMGAKVKSPIELLIQCQQQTGLKLNGILTYEYCMDRLGQTLFNPYNVGGWPSGKSWLNGNYLISRHTLIKQLFLISNRKFEKQSLAYKVHSWINHSNLRFVRWKCDSTWDSEELYNTISQYKIHPSQWLLGEKINTNSVNKLVQHPNYQYH